MIVNEDLVHTTLPLIFFLGMTNFKRIISQF